MSKYPLALSLVLLLIFSPVFAAAVIAQSSSSSAPASVPWNGNIFASAFGEKMGWVLFGRPAADSPYVGLYRGVMISATPTVAGGSTYAVSGEAYSPYYGVLNFNGTTVSTINGSPWAVMAGNAVFSSTGERLSLRTGTPNCDQYKIMSVLPDPINYGVCIDTAPFPDSQLFGYAYSNQYGYLRFTGNDGGLTPPKLTR